MPSSNNASVYITNIKTRLMKNIDKYFIVLLVLILPFSCQNKKSKEIETILKKMQGRVVYFPSTLRSVYMGKDTLCPTMLKNENKIVVYVDSIGCTECNMKIQEWTDIFKCTRDSLPNLSIIYIVSPKKGQSQKITSIFRKYEIDYPFFIDSLNQFGNLNEMPKERKYHTFLIDRQNRIVLVGSPMHSDKIWQLYKDYVRKQIGASDATTENASELNPAIEGITQIHLNQDSVNLGKLSYSSTKNTTFQIKNKGDHPLVIQTINTECGCTVAKYDKKPIAKGETATVILEYKPNSLGYFSKSADVICNIARGYLRLTISGEVVKN